MIVNTTRQKLAAGEVVLGCFIRSHDPTIAEIAGLAGFDFVVSDGEHGGVSSREFENVARAADSVGVDPFVRVPDGAHSTLLRFMDAGAHGVHVPWVDTPAEAASAVAGVKYQPLGTRGLAGTRASDHGRGEPLAAYIDRANRETMVVVQIESPTAVADTAAICAVPGVDVVFVGPTDLSNSMGLTGQVEHPDVVAAVDRVIDAARATATVVGIFAGSSDAAARWIERGVRYVTTGAEGQLGRSLHSFLEPLR